MSKSVLPVFSSRRYVVSSLTFKPLIHFEFIFWIYFCIWCEKGQRSPFDSFACSCPVFPTPFIEEAVFAAIVYSFLLFLEVIDLASVDSFSSILYCYPPPFLWLDPLPDLQAQHLVFRILSSLRDLTSSVCFRIHSVQLPVSPLGFGVICLPTQHEYVHV